MVPNLFSTADWLGKAGHPPPLRTGRGLHSHMHLDTLMHVWNGGLVCACVHSCTCTKGGCTLANGRGHSNAHPKRLCGGECMQGVGGLSPWPRLAQATDRHRATDRGLGTPDLRHFDTEGRWSKEFSSPGDKIYFFCLGFQYIIYFFDLVQIMCFPLGASAFLI